MTLTEINNALENTGFLVKVSESNGMFVVLDLQGAPGSQVLGYYSHLDQVLATLLRVCTLTRRA
jgi:hypothetical protein